MSIPHWLLLPPRTFSWYPILPGSTWEPRSSSFNLPQWGNEPMILGLIQVAGTVCLSLDLPLFGSASVWICLMLQPEGMSDDNCHMFAASVLLTPVLCCSSQTIMMDCLWKLCNCCIFYLMETVWPVQSLQKKKNNKVKQHLKQYDWQLENVE